MEAKDVLTHMDNQLNRLDFESFYTRSWGIWKDRCNLAHKLNDKLVLSNDSIPRGWTDCLLQDFRKAQSNNHVKYQNLTERYSYIHQTPTTSG